MHLRLAWCWLYCEVEYFFKMSKIFLVLGLFALVSCETRLFKINNPAMEGTIKTGSQIYVNHEAEISSYDMVAFIGPSQSGQTFVFRLIGMPGDSLKISEGNVFINNSQIKEVKTIQHGYILIADRSVNERVFEERGILEYYKFPQGYMIHATKEQVTKLRKLSFVKSIEMFQYEPNDIDDRMFSDFKNSNKDHLEIYVPKRGDIIQPKDFLKYAVLIEKYEGGELNGLENYTFKNSYCFVMGDNRDNAMDSRYIGLVPMNNVLGTVTVLF
jgi:signal peptidase I